jgi:hypothetical protein
MTDRVVVMKNGHENSKYLRYSQLWSRDYELQYFQPSSHIHKEQPGKKKNIIQIHTHICKIFLK